MCNRTAACHLRLAAWAQEPAICALSVYSIPSESVCVGLDPQGVLRMGLGKYGQILAWMASTHRIGQAVDACLPGTVQLFFLLISSLNPGKEGHRESQLAETPGHKTCHGAYKSSKPQAHL